MGYAMVNPICAIFVNLVMLTLAVIIIPRFHLGQWLIKNSGNGDVRSIILLILSGNKSSSAGGIFILSSLNFMANKFMLEKPLLINADRWLGIFQ